MAGFEVSTEEKSSTRRDALQFYSSDDFDNASSQGRNHEVLIEPLAWDSAFFGKRIGRYTKHTVTTEDASAFQLRSEDYDCIYFFLDPRDAVTAAVVADNRLFLADIKTVYRCDKKHMPGTKDIPGIEIGILDAERTPDGARLVVNTARALSSVSRFAFDPRFAAKAPALYEIWARKFFHDPHGATIVGRVNGEVAGFVGVERDGEVGKLTLVCTVPGHEGKGVGWSVVHAAMEWCFEQGASAVETTTQYRNIAANRHYQRSGFLLYSTSLVYHLWKEE